MFFLSLRNGRFRKASFHKNLYSEDNFSPADQDDATPFVLYPIRGVFSGTLSFEGSLV